MKLEGSNPSNVSSSSAHAVPASPFNVGSLAQLFVDRVLVREARGIAFTLHPAEKHPDNPLVVADRPWESWRLESYGTVLHDEDDGIFKMWYWSPSSPGYAIGVEDVRQPLTLYATSEDGVKWEKPLVGTVPALRGDRFDHNVVATVLNANVIKDKDDPDPDRRYKMICYRSVPKQSSGYHTMVSPDGLHWSELSTSPISPGRDVITGYYDDARGLYVAFPKIATTVRGHSRRVFYVITSEDFQHWTEPRLAFAPDLWDDAGSLHRLEEVRPILDVPDAPELMRTEFYGVGVYLAESCTIAFPWVFTINNDARYGNHEGPIELQLAASRDLSSWERHFRIPCVPRSEPGEWDCGINFTPAQALRVGDEIWLYYDGSTYTHGTPCVYRAEGTGQGTEHTASIGLAKWKLDRFVSADGSADGGMLTTVPIVFSGERLEINALTKRGGTITVELLDAAGSPMNSFPPSNPFTGDNLRGVVTWPDGGGGVGRFIGKPVTLRFHLRDAELYSFAFRE